MLFNFSRFEVFIGKCLFDWYYLPRLYKRKAEIFFSWLGGCIVYSRLKRTHKDTDGI
jgi:hypothetical protein